MYWIEIYFENGKTLKKETVNLNESYKVLRRYETGAYNRFRIQMIRAGINTSITYEKSFLAKVVT